MKHHFKFNQKVQVRLTTLLFMLIATQFGQGCIWWVMEGVHFKSPTMDFTKPPRQFAHHYEASDGWRPGTAYLAEGDITPRPIHEFPFEMYKTGAQIRSDFIAKAMKFEKSHRYKKALGAWETAWHKGLVGQGDLRDRIAVLRLLADNPKLDGGAAVLAGIPLNEVSGPMPAASTVAPSLRPFADYALATIAKDEPMTMADKLAFVAGNYPKSPVAESALISVPRVLLGSKAGTPGPASIAMSRRAMNRLLTKYPQTRFRLDVVGWQGRIAYLAGDYAMALATYRKQLAMIKNGDSVWKATDSIELCEQKLGRPANVAIAFLVRYARAAEAKEKDDSTALLESALGKLKGEAAISFGHQVRSDPQLLSYYLDYRLDFTDPTPELLALNNAACLSKASRQIRGHVKARIAEAALRLHKNSQAIRLAEQIKGTSALPDDLAMADYIRGTLARKSGRTNAAIESLEHLKVNYPKSYLVGAAMENLALLHESQGRLGEALDLYRKLSYDYDVTYMVDIRMSPQQLQSYIETHRNDPQRNLLKFSLGFRYLRDHSWDEAESIFSSLSKKTRLKLLNRKEITDYYDQNDPVQDPLQTTRDLNKLSRAVDRADGATSRAKAKLAEANYFYNRRNLLLYNASLWKGSRSYIFAYSWNDKSATKADNVAISRHHWEHECLAQAYLLCRQIVESKANEATRTRAAYVAACAGERLSKMNEYWRWKNTRINVLGSSIKLMRIAAKSPNKWLAARAAKYAGVFQQEQRESHEGGYSRGMGGAAYRVDWGS